jgi:FMN phosphatase YigB (HAD superfamily)
MARLSLDRASFDAVSIDVDGTLYDIRLQRAFLLPYLLRHPLLLPAYPRVVASVRGERHEDLRGELARRLGEEVGANPDRARQVIDQVVHGALPATLGPHSRMRGLVSALEALDREGIPRAVLSDYPAERKLHNMDLSEGWAALICCEDLGALKPLPDGLKAAAEAMGLPPDRVLHIGDREDTDGEMARAAGAPCLILGRDFTRWSELERALA